MPRVKVTVVEDSDGGEIVRVDVDDVAVDLQNLNLDALPPGYACEVVARGATKPVPRAEAALFTESGDPRVIFRTRSEPSFACRHQTLVNGGAGSKREELINFIIESFKSYEIGGGVLAYEVQGDEALARELYEALAAAVEGDHGLSAGDVGFMRKRDEKALREWAADNYFGKDSPIFCKFNSNWRTLVTTKPLYAPKMTGKGRIYFIESEDGPGLKKRYAVLEDFLPDWTCHQISVLFELCLREGRVAEALELIQTSAEVGRKRREAVMAHLCDKAARLGCERAPEVLRNACFSMNFKSLKTISHGDAVEVVFFGDAYSNDECLNGGFCRDPDAATFWLVNAPSPKLDQGNLPTNWTNPATRSLVPRVADQLDEVRKHLPEGVSAQTLRRTYPPLKRVEIVFE